MSNSKVFVIDDISEVCKTTADVLFFDIEETILSPNKYYDALGYRTFCIKFLEICEELEMSAVHLMNIGKNFKRTLTQSIIPSFMYQLRASGKQLFALTSGHPSFQKKMRIREMGIRFDGYLFTKGSEKGDFLFRFLITNNLSHKCAFIDNHEEKINSVKVAFEKYFHRDSELGYKEVDLFLYNKNAKKEIDITIDDFVKYWHEVAVAIRKGAIEELKQALLDEKEKKRKKKLMKSKNEDIQSHLDEEEVTEDLEIEMNLSE